MPQLVLDAGMGSEPNHKKNWFNLKGKVIGIDIRKHHKPDVVCDTQNLPFQNEVFDKINASEILEHLPNALKGLREWNRTLKLNNRLYVTVPNGAWMPVFVNTMRNKKVWTSHPEHYNMWNYGELHKLLRIAGFKILQTSFFTRYLMKGRLPMIAYLLRHALPSVMHMNIMVVAEKAER